MIKDAGKITAVVAFVIMTALAVLSIVYKDSGNMLFVAGTLLFGFVILFGTMFHRI